MPDDSIAGNKLPSEKCRKSNNHPCNPKSNPNLSDNHWFCPVSKLDNRTWPAPFDHMDRSMKRDCPYNIGVFTGKRLPVIVLPTLRNDFPSPTFKCATREATQTCPIITGFVRFQSRKSEHNRAPSGACPGFMEYTIYLSLSGIITEPRPICFLESS